MSGVDGAFLYTKCRFERTRRCWSEWSERLSPHGTMQPVAEFVRVSQQNQTDSVVASTGMSVRRVQMRITNRRKVAIRAVVTAVACSALLLPASARATAPRAHPEIKRGGIVTVVSRIGGSWVSNFNPGTPSDI